MQTQDLSKFEKKLIIRQIQREDFKTIIELQKICLKI